MKKFYVLSLFCLAMIPSMAENTSQVNDTVDKQIPVSEYQMLMPLQPTYHKNVTEAANWGSNWFITRMLQKQPTGVVIGLLM